MEKNVGENDEVDVQEEEEEKEVEREKNRVSCVKLTMDTRTWGQFSWLPAAEASRPRAITST